MAIVDNIETGQDLGFDKYNYTSPFNEDEGVRVATSLETNSVYGNLATAFKMENLAVMGIMKADEVIEAPTFVIDPKFNPEDSDYKDMLNVMKDGQKEALKRTESEAEFMYKYEKFANLNKEAEALDESGAGLLYRVTAGILDPVNLIAGVGVLSKGARASLFLKGAAFEGTAEAARWKLDDFDEHNLNTVGVSLFLGGALNSIGRGFDIPNQHVYKEDELDIADDLIDNSRIDNNMPLEGGTARKVTLKEKALKLIEKTDLSMAGMMARSSSQSIRKVADKLYSYHLANGRANVGSVQDVYTSMYNPIMNKFNMNIRPLLNEWTTGSDKQSVGSFLSTGTKVHDFNKAMGDMIAEVKITGTRSIDDLSPLESKVLGVHTDTMNEVFKEAQLLGHKRFKDLKPDDMYAHISYSPTKLHTLFERFGRTKTAQKAVTELFNKAIATYYKNMGKEYNEQLSTDVATVMVDKMFKSKVHNQKGFDIRSSDSVVENLMEKHGVPKEAIDDIMSILNNKVRASAKKDSDSITNRRTLMDRGVTIDLEDGTTLGFMDIMDTSMDTLVQGYVHKTAGRTALHSADLDDVAIDKLSKDVIDEGASNEDIARLEATINFFRGFPTGNMSKEGYNRAATIANNLAVAKYLGQTFWTMTAETAALWQRLGIKRLLQNLPAFKAIWDMYTKGTVTNEVYKDLYNFGFAKEILELSTHSRFDSDSFISAGVDYGKLEKGSMLARDLTLHVGGIKPLTVGLDLTMGAGTIDKVVKLIGKTRLSKTQKEDLATMKFDKEFLDSLAPYVKDGRLLMDDIEDAQLQNRFVMGIRREVDRVIQKSDWSSSFGYSSGNELLSQSPLGKLFLNLKSYAIASYSKQLGYMLSREDAMLSQSAIAMTVLGAISYMAQEAVNHSLSDKPLSEYASTEKALLKGIERSTPVSILPNVVDTVGGITFGDGIFRSVNYGDSIYGNLIDAPAKGLITDILNTKKGLAGLIGDGYNNKDMSKVISILPNYSVVNAWKNYLKDN